MVIDPRLPDESAPATAEARRRVAENGQKADEEGLGPILIRFGEEIFDASKRLMEVYADRVRIGVRKSILQAVLGVGERGPEGVSQRVEHPPDRGGLAVNGRLLIRQRSQRSSIQPVWQHWAGDQRLADCQQQQQVRRETQQTRHQRSLEQRQTQQRQRQPKLTDDALLYSSWLSRTHA